MLSSKTGVYAGSNCARKETVDIGIPLTSRNGELVESVPMNIYQIYNHRKDLCWLHFDNEPKVPANHSILKNGFSSKIDPSIFT